MKLKLGAIKGKLIVGTLTAGLVISGAGFAFANTDAGQALKQWYNGMFSNSVDTINDEVNAYGESKMPALLAEYESLKSDASLKIDITRELETGKSLEQIVNAKLSHIGSLDESKQEILESIGLQFYNVYIDGFLEISRLGDEGLTYATNDLTAFTNGLGQEAVDQLTADLTGAKEQAVAELEDAIQQAQEELAAAIDTQEEATIRNLKNWVDWTIADLRVAVTELLAGLVENQKAIIVAAAQELENDAKAALDEVVSGINN